MRIGGETEAPPCPVCLRPLSRGLTTNCDHTFCDHCVATHCWRCALVHNRLATCPICRSAIKNLRPFADGTTADSFRFAETRTVRFGRQEYELDVRTASGETLTHRLIQLFGIPPDRLKLIYKGRVLTTEDEMAACKGTMQLLGTPQSLQIPKGNAVIWVCRHVIQTIQANSVWAVQRLGLLALRDKLLQASWWKKCRHVFSVFVASMSPNYKPPTRFWLQERKEHWMQTGGVKLQSDQVFSTGGAHTCLLRICRCQLRFSRTPSSNLQLMELTPYGLYWVGEVFQQPRLSTRRLQIVLPVL